MKFKIILFCFVFFAIVYGIIAICLVWLPSRAPLFAWRYGTPEMQRRAATGVIKLYPPGTPINTVIENVGPGSLGWQKTKGYKVEHIESWQISFNVDGRFVHGITFYYKDGKVTGADIFD